MGNIARFINHSCEPNCAPLTWKDRGKEKIFIFSIRDISIGEELTYNYKLDLNSCEEIIECNCGSNECSTIMGVGRKKLKEYLDEK